MLPAVEHSSHTKQIKSKARIASISQDGQQVALAKGQWVHILHLTGSKGLRQEELRTRVCSGQESITALSWVTFTGAAPGNTKRVTSCSLLVGTSLGFLQLHSAHGTTLHRQRLHTQPCQNIHIRTCSMGLQAHQETEDVTLAFPDAVVCISSLELQAFLYQTPRTPDREHDPGVSLSISKWDLPRSAGPRSDALCLGMKPSSLKEVMAHQGTGQKLLILTTGRSPAIAGYEAQECSGEGALQMVSEIVSTVAASVSGFARNVVKGRPDGLRAGVRSWMTSHHATEGVTGGKADTIAAPPGESSTLLRCLPDEPRLVTTLAVAPRSSMAVAGDSLGRALLIDVASLSIVRLWKSYRHVQTAWLLRPCNAGRDSQDEAQLLLALFAPKRACVELWQPRLGPRLCSIPCSSTALLLSPAGSFGGQSDLPGSLTAWLYDPEAGTTVDILEAMRIATSLDKAANRDQ